MTTDDLLMIAVLLTIGLVVLVFPGGPGTPRRFKQDADRLRHK
ncbi:MAG: hypothetical protein ABUS49_04010 [Acidobacteriota bacterium]